MFLCLKIYVLLSKKLCLKETTYLFLYIIFILSEFPFYLNEFTPKIY